MILVVIAFFLMLLFTLDFFGKYQKLNFVLHHISII